MFHARRRHDLFNPSLIGSLLVVTALGVIAGLALFGKLMADDIDRQDRARLNDAAMVSAARVDRILLQAGLDMDHILRQLDRPAVAPSSETIREIRREASEMLRVGPLSGIALINSDEGVVLDIAESDFASRFAALAQPLKSDAKLLSSRLQLVLPEHETSPVLYLQSEADAAWRMVGALDPEILPDALRPANSGAVVESYLIDAEGRVLGAGHHSTQLQRLDLPGAPYNAAPLDEAAVTVVADQDQGDRLFATSLLGDSELRVALIGMKQSGGVIFERAALLTIALVGPCLVGLILLISIIQNEWRKSDRRANNSADAVARAEIASDLLQAGIVDWSTRDSSVVYTHGWHELFGYADSVSGEQVFDWIARIHPEDRSDARRRYQDLMDGVCASAEHTIRVLCADGSYTNVRERAAVRTDEAGTVMRIILVQTPFVRERAQKEAA